MAKKKEYVVSREVVVDTGGITITRLHLSPEAVEGLTARGVRSIQLTEPAPDKDSYYFQVQVGDFVRLPNEKTGTVCAIEFHGQFKVASVRLDVGKRRWFGLFPPIPERFVDEKINQLQLIATQADMDAY